MLNTTAKLFTGWIVLTMGLTWGTATAFSNDMAATGIAQSIVGQARTAKEECRELLRRARRAMAENDLDGAAKLVNQAEKLDVSFGMLDTFADTPEKVRRDLQRKRAAMAEAAKPSSRFSPLSIFGIGEQKEADSDPFAKRDAADQPSARTAPGQVPGQLKDRKGQAQTYLLKGRAELAKNNLPAAVHWYHQAAAIDAKYGAKEDSPAKLAADIRARGGRITQPPANDRAAAVAPPERPEGSPVRSLPSPPPRIGGADQAATPPPVGSGNQLPAALSGMRGAKADARGAQADPRQQSNHFLRSARKALAVGDIRRAEDFVRQAEQLGLAYPWQEDSPLKVREDIDNWRQLAEQPDNRRSTEAYRRQYARLMMDQSESLLRWGELDQAERLAHLASDQRVLYAPTEMKPSDLLQRIARQRRGPSAPNEQLAAHGMAMASDGGGAASADYPAGGDAKQQVLEMTRQARAALSQGDLQTAERLARGAQRLGVPDQVFAPNQDRPGLVLLDVFNAKRESSAVVRTGGEFVMPATGEMPDRQRADQALYDASRDHSRNMQAASQQTIDGRGPRRIDVAQRYPTPAPPREENDPDGSPFRMQPVPEAAGPGMSLFQQGEAALRQHDTKKAYQLFRQAAGHMREMDPMTAQRLQERLQLLGPNAVGGPADGPGQPAVDEARARQQVLARQVLADLARLETEAEAKRETEPKAALEMLQEARSKVEDSGLETTMRQRLLRRVDERIASVQRFMNTNAPVIAQEEHNQRVRDDRDRERKMKIEVDEKVAMLVDRHNKLIDEQRYAEADVVAKQAAELAPDNPAVEQLLLFSKFRRRFEHNLALEEQREQGFWAQLDSVDESAVGFDDRRPIRFGDNWDELTERRRRFARAEGRQRSERELEIEQKLRTPVSLQFNNAPLSRVLEHLANLAQVNLHLDPQGLAEEAVSESTPVTINLSQEISLKSALNLILQPLHLSYVIKDEVLKITSEQLRDGEVYTVTYDVADLVVPIPNFVPGQMGIDAAMQKAYSNLGYGGMGGGAFGSQTAPMAVLANDSGECNTGAINPAVLAQLSAGGGGAATGQSMPMGFGPGGLGGGAQADFDSLIELITSTVKPQTWDEVGGPGSIAPFETNLSVVVSQTQDVHEEIVDLLEQLRRLQDLQVTIEVRFITLNDNFFERIGVDFDFDIDDDIDRPFQVFGRTIEGTADPATGAEPARNTLDTDYDESVTVGLQAPGVFSADLDIPFNQNSFGLAVPQFGGFDASAGAQMGFAILSDIEAFFFINAAQGDRRSNVLQAPKVTLFNGQQAFVSDTSQSPFVISVIPVVGDFAAAQQPVIVVLSEGTFMTVQAVVSKDRRFVRLTVVPFFSSIGDDVETFQFTGSETTTTDTSADGWVDPNDPDDDRRNADSEQTTTERSGTTVQLPTFSFVTVTTTVSVPDGGTVLLGGIKRLSEGRNEFGVPMLNKIPYVNRLFKNVGIGRETQSLMMMVTPRIIIQEEEEERIGAGGP